MFIAKLFITENKSEGERERKYVLFCVTLRSMKLILYAIFSVHVVPRLFKVHNMESLVEGSEWWLKVVTDTQKKPFCLHFQNDDGMEALQ